MRVLGFFAATSAVTDDADRLTLGDAAFATAAAADLPTTLSVTVVVVYAADPGYDVSFTIGLRRPDGSLAENQHGLTVVLTGRYATLTLPVVLFEEGEHELLLHPLGDTTTVLASYPFGVQLLST